MKCRVDNQSTNWSRKFGCLFLLALIGSSGQAFTLNSSTEPNLEGWESGDVQLMVNTANCPAGVDVPGLVSDAVGVWNNVPTSSIKVSYGGTTSGTNFSSPPTVYCAVNFSSVTDGANEDGVPGAASVRTSGGRITTGVIYLNASAGRANLANLNRTTLTIVLAHEIGHLLGLGHSESTNALMYYDATLKTKLSLAQDDMDGMSYLYPSNELQNGKLAGCGMTTKSDMPPPSSGFLTVMIALLIAPLILCSELRRRNRLSLNLS